MNFDMSRAFNNATSILSRHGSMIALLIALGVVVQVILQMVLGGSQEQMVAELTAVGTDPSAMLPVLGRVLLGASIGSLVASAAAFVAMRYALRDGGEPVGGMFGFAIGAAITTFLFGLVIGLVIGLPLALIIGLVAAAGGGGMASGLVAIVLILFMLPLLLWIVSRMFVMGPAMADEASINPLFGFSRSWALTGPSQGRIMLYALLLIIVGVVFFLLVGGVLGLVGGTVGEVLAGLGTGIPVGIAQVAIAVGAYQELNPASAADTFT